MLLKRLFLSAILASFGAGIAFLARNRSWEQIEGFLQSLPYFCPLKKFTGLECAFCGMTHSWLALFRGEWMKAFHYNWLGPIFFVLVAVFILVDRFRKIISDHRRTTAWMAIGVLTVYMVVRNLKNVF